MGIKLSQELREIWGRWLPRMRAVSSALPYLLVVYFVARALFLAVDVPNEVPPDETVHRVRVALFEGTSPFSEASEQANPVQARTVQHSPFLYYLLAGLWAQLNVFNAPDYLFIRLLSLPFGLLFLWLGWSCICTLSENRAVRVLFLLMLSNTLMVTALSAAISWDMLSIVFAAAAAQQFVRFWKHGDAGQFLRVLLFLTLGALTKSTLFPLCIMLSVALLIAAFAKRDTEASVSLAARLRAKPLLLIATAVVMLFATIFFGKNVIAYGTPVPRPHALVETDELWGHPSAIRTHLVREYSEDRITFEEAKALAEQISHQRTSSETVNLLMREQYRKQQGGFEPMSRFAYFEPYIKLMTRSTYGFLGHRVKYLDSRELIPFYVVHGMGLIGALVLLRRKEVIGAEVALAIITFLFALFVMQVVCYKQYLRLHVEFAGIQGRYLFPVIVPFYALVARGLVEAPPRWLAIPAIVAVSALFIYADFWFYVTNSFVF